LESQIETLDRLIWVTEDESILSEINLKIEEFTNEIDEKQTIIDDAQDAFNEIAERTNNVRAAREVEVEE
jgi:hypothetical protein